MRSDDEASIGVSRPTSLTVVVPLFNEADRFEMYAPELVTFVSRDPSGSELVFVDDGSSDGTVDIVEKFAAIHNDAPLRLLRQPHRGKGSAVTTGLMSADSEIACFCDLDLATPLDDLARIGRGGGGGPAPGHRITRRRLRSNHTTPGAWPRGPRPRDNKAIQFSLLPGIVDTQCGAKAARTAVCADPSPYERKRAFAWDVEVIALARAIGVQVREIGVQWRHQEGSRVNVLRDGARMVRAIPRIRHNLNDFIRREPLSPTKGAMRSTAKRPFSSLQTIRRIGGFDRRPRSSLLLIRRFAPTDGWLVDIGAGPGGVTAMLGLGSRPKHGVGAQCRDGAGDQTPQCSASRRGTPPSSPLRMRRCMSSASST